VLHPCAENVDFTEGAPRRLPVTTDTAPIRDLLLRISTLPSIGLGLSRLLALDAGSPDVLERAVPIIEGDPALAAHVMRLANSAAFAGSEVVDSVERAVMRVGPKVLVGSIAQARVAAAFGPRGRWELALWNQAVLGANLAREFAAAAPTIGIPPATAYTQALLHDVGRLVMAPLIGPLMDEIHGLAGNLRTDLAPIERGLLGYDHATAGRLLAVKWKLPSMLTLVISTHHDPRAIRPPEADRACALMAAVDEVLSLLPHDGSTEPDARIGDLLSTPDTANVLAGAGLTPAAARDALAASLESCDRQRKMLGLPRS